MRMFILLLSLQNQLLLQFAKQGYHDDVLTVINEQIKSESETLDAANETVKKFELQSFDKWDKESPVTYLGQEFNLDPETVGDEKTFQQAILNQLKSSKETITVLDGIAVPLKGVQKWEDAENLRNIKFAEVQKQQKEATTAFENKKLEVRKTMGVEDFTQYGDDGKPVLDTDGKKQRVPMEEYLTTAKKGQPPLYKIDDGQLKFVGYDEYVTRLDTALTSKPASAPSPVPTSKPTTATTPAAAPTPSVATAEPDDETIFNRLG